MAHGVFQFAQESVGGQGPAGVPTSAQAGSVGVGQIERKLLFPIEAGRQLVPLPGVEQAGGILVAAVSGGAGPGISAGDPAEAGADRVALDVAHGQQAMRIVHGIGVKAILPQMAAAAVEAVDVLGVEPMGSADRLGQGFGVLGDGDQVDVVVHEAVAEDAHAIPLALAGQDFQVRAAVVINEERPGGCCRAASGGVEDRG